MRFHRFGRPRCKRGSKICRSSGKYLVLFACAVVMSTAVYSAAAPIMAPKFWFQLRLQVLVGAYGGCGSRTRLAAVVLNRTLRIVSRARTGTDGRAL